MVSCIHLYFLPLYTYSRGGPESNKCALSGEDVRSRDCLYLMTVLRSLDPLKDLGNLTIFPLWMAQTQTTPKFRNMLIQLLNLLWTLCGNPGLCKVQKGRFPKMLHVSTSQEQLNLFKLSSPY